MGEGEGGRGGNCIACMCLGDGEGEALVWFGVRVRRAPGWEVQQLSLLIAGQVLLQTRLPQMGGSRARSCGLRRGLSEVAVLVCHGTYDVQAFRPSSAPSTRLP